MLLMKKIFFDAIRSGAKTTTLRYWRSQRVTPGSVQKIPGLGHVHIDSVRLMRVKDLRSSDARADGFENLADLKRTLREMYPPECRSGRTLYQIHFTLL
ncbi:MAG: ASCH domain-containing protein, partial [Planctomycetota bacterium]